mgnify:CR=1 FL=1
MHRRDRGQPSRRRTRAAPAHEGGQSFRLVTSTRAVCEPAGPLKRPGFVEWWSSGRSRCAPRSIGSASPVQDTHHRYDNKLPHVVRRPHRRRPISSTLDCAGRAELGGCSHRPGRHSGRPRTQPVGSRTQTASSAPRETLTSPPVTTSLNGRRTRYLPPSSP